MSISISRVNPGVTLRHWSADSRSFKGGSARPGPAPAGLTEGRRMNQVAAMLKQIRTPQAK
jgi:hypothetical protein